MASESDHSPCDSEAARLLPWLINGRLDAADAARVEMHVAECPVCRADWREQQALQALLRGDDRVEYAPQASLEKLMTRIDELDREPKAPGEGSVAERARTGAVQRASRWLVAALVVQTFGLGVLGALLWRHAPGESSSPRYATLTSAPVSTNGAPRIRVVFAPRTSLAELTGLLHSVQGTIISGPSEAGAFTVAIAGRRSRPRDADAAVLRLRADPRVLFAEPVTDAATTH